MAKKKKVVVKIRKKSDDFQVSPMVKAHNDAVLARGTAVAPQRPDIELEPDPALDKFEKDFYPKHPEYKNKQQLRRLGFRKRQERWLQSFNATSGFLSKAHEAAGVKKAEYDRWIKDDEDFQNAFSAVKDYIVDRCRYLLSMRAGLVKPLPFAHLNKMDSNALMARLKSLAPEEFGDKLAGEVVIRFDIPRPERNTDKLPASRETKALSHDDG